MHYAKKDFYFINMLLKKNLFLLFVVLSATRVMGQNQASEHSIADFLPSKNEKIYALSLGIIGSEVLCNSAHTQISSGVNIQLIGQGMFQWFYIKQFDFKQILNQNDDSIPVLFRRTPPRVVHHGIVVSTFGTFTDNINGVSVSGSMSMGNRVNGLSINTFWNVYNTVNGISIGLVNHAVRLSGVQIGLFNNAVTVQGLQIGLWNRNKKRSLPVINF